MFQDFLKWFLSIVSRPLHFRASVDMHADQAVRSKFLADGQKFRDFTVKPIHYIFLLVLTVYGSYVFQMRTEGIFACPSGGYEQNRYLAFCMGEKYGEYDHGAFWFDLEPEALRSAANSEVLFVGSSRMQHAFSSKATEDWFASPAVSYFLLGFSNGGNVQFADPLLEKIRPKAKVYILNIDRFFDTVESRMVAEVFHDKSAGVRNIRKKRWQPLHRMICTFLPAICGNAFALFRSRKNGSWSMTKHSWYEPVDVSIGPAGNEDQWANYAALGEEFISKLPVERDCVLLTIVPYPETKLAEAEVIARALNMNLIAPDVGGLVTFDRSHLDLPSRERWSKAFFNRAGLQIHQCLHDAERAQG